jgi:hypothetical protein
MKRALFFLFAIFVSLSIPSLVKAKPPQSQALKRASIQQRIEEKKQLIQQKREEIRQRIAIKKATRSAQISSARRIRIRAFWDRLDARFQATITRLEKLITRIESRISIINAYDSNINTDYVEAQLSIAKEMLSEARIELEAASEHVDDILSSQDPKTSFEIIKDSVLQIKMDLKEVHQILVHTIGNIKGLRSTNTPKSPPVGTPSATPSAGN